MVTRTACPTVAAPGGPAPRSVREPDDDMGIAGLDSRLVVRQANELFSRRVGGRPGEMPGRRFPDLVRPEARPRLVRRLFRLVNGTDHRFTTAIAPALPDGRRSDLTLTAFAIRGGPPDSTAILVALSRSHAPVRTEQPQPAAAPGHDYLDQVDARILEGIAAGQSTLNLAARLHFSRQNIDYRVTGLLRRFQVPNRTALVSRAFSTGLLDTGTWPPKVVADVVR
ncbi:helix-turn-helix transcriptional regulator [Streptomyces sp. NPDC018031]|uniref:helix-turn-helix transcriptional regulator n=1 Tax=Streptomyces sp. NPDC018031 TaxID=3365033 RepID=UPI0037B97795